jgi:hypothetical protein
MGASREENWNMGREDKTDLISIKRPVITQFVGWENPDPTTKWWQLRGHLTTVPLGWKFSLRSA